MAVMRLPDRKGIIEYMASLGLDANTIVDDGWDKWGYYEMLPGYDDEGYRRKTWRRWPPGFDYEKMLSFYYRQERPNGEE
jgi:hypothetical protein